MNPKFDTLTLQRTQPVQGKPVAVVVLWNGGECGKLELPFGAWLKIKRLMEKGTEADAREGSALQLNLGIRGVPQSHTETGLPIGLSENLIVTRESVSNIAREEEEDEDLAAVEKAEAQASGGRELPAPGQVRSGAIRSLRGGENG